MDARRDVQDALLHSFATAAEDPGAATKQLMTSYDAFMLRRYADYLSDKLGVTNRASGVLRRLAELKGPEA